MTDTVTFYRSLVSQTNQFVQAWEALKLMHDRLLADSFLPGQAATSAQASGRTDLTAADFDNVKNAVTVVQTLLDSTNAAVNTGGSVKLAFYKML